MLVLYVALEISKYLVKNIYQHPNSDSAIMFFLVVVLAKSTYSGVSSISRFTHLNNAHCNNGQRIDCPQPSIFSCFFLRSFPADFLAFFFFVEK